MPVNRGLLQIIAACVALMAVGFGLLVSDGSERAPDAVGKDGPQVDARAIEPVMQANATVLRVIDGDTFEAAFDTGETRTVRLLGIDTPETVDPRKTVECFGKEASQKLTDLIDGTRIFLDADPEADEVDRYERLLRNAYLTDGTDVNALLVRDGFAHAYTSFPLRSERKAELRELEREAREAGRGLWALDACE